VDPDDARPLHNKWQNAGQAGKNKEAQVQRNENLESLESLIQKDPDYSPSWVCEEASSGLSDLRGSRAFVQQSIELDPQSARRILNGPECFILWNVCTNMPGPANGSRELLNNPTWEGYAANLAECLIKAGDFAGGRAASFPALKGNRNPGIPMCHAVLIFSSRVLEGDGDNGGRRMENFQFYR